MAYPDDDEGKSTYLWEPRRGVLIFVPPVL